MIDVCFQTIEICAFQMIFVWVFQMIDVWVFQMIDEGHMCYPMKFLRNKPVKDLKDEQFLKIVQVGPLCLFLSLPLSLPLSLSFFLSLSLTLFLSLSDTFSLPSRHLHLNIYLCTVRFSQSFCLSVCLCLTPSLKSEPHQAFCPQKNLHILCVIKFAVPGLSTSYCL